MSDAPPSQPRWTAYMPLNEIVPADVNAKGHSIPLLLESINRFGYTEPGLWCERKGQLAAGHGRLEALGALLEAQAQGLEPPDGIVVGDDGRWLMPITRGWRSENDDEFAAYVIASNRVSEVGGWINETLVSELQRAAESSRGLAGIGYSQDDFDALLGLSDPGSVSVGGAAAASGPNLADRFLVPPFSVFDARQGYWQDRKRQWLSLGIRSEVGRAHNLLKMSDTVLEAQGGKRMPNQSVPASHSGNDPAYYWKKQEVERRLGRPLTNEEFEADHYEADAYVGGTSIFDPVLCEIAYRWWCPAQGRVLDPFAGGSVRGLVAALLDRDYVGIDLSGAQCQANREQLNLVPDGMPLPRWLEGNAAEVLPELDEEPFDLLFTCPPYFDLERYSDDPGDLSNAGSYTEFLLDYNAIIRQAVERLADDRFACVVVGDIRDKDGLYRGFVPDTIQAFEDAGCSFYNDIVLVTAVGSLALRAARIFGGGRKVGKAHQNVLVFVKGDPAKAAEACAPVEQADVLALFGEVLEPEPAAATVAAEEEGPSAAPAEPAVPHANGSAGPAWAKGYDLIELQGLADLFREHDGDLPLGAFSAAKEATVASWLEKGQLRLGDGCAAVVAPIRQWEDFAGSQWRFAPSACLRRMACAPGHERDLLKLLHELQPIAAEIWQEHPVERWLVEELGLEWYGTKIRASSELIGLWGPSPPLAGVSGYREPDYWALARLDIRFDAQLLAQEVQDAALEFADHYAVYNKRNSWSALALRGYGADEGFIIKPSEMSKKWKADHPDELRWTIEDTALARRLPLCWALAESIPGAKHRVRLMRLAPGHGELARHADITDPDAGTKPGRLLRLHAPLVTNERVEFHAWQPDGNRQRAHMAAGEVWWLDTRKPHTATNDGDTDRIHLVIDVESSHELLASISEPAAVDHAVEQWQPS